MREVLDDMKYYLFGLRWITLIIAFLYHTHSLEGNYKLIYIIISFNVLYAVLLVSKINKIQWRIILLIDLIAGMIFIVQTGGWTSPYLFYNITTLVWMSFYMSLNKVLYLSIFSSLMMLLLSHLVVNQFIMPPSYYNQVKTITQIITIVSLYLFIKYFISNAKSIFKRCNYILIYIKRINSKESYKEIAFFTEKIIKRAFTDSDVYMIWLNNSQHNDWTKNYYVAAIKEKGQINKENVSQVNLVDHLGKNKNFYYFPIKKEDEIVGVILIYTDGRQHLSYYYLYLKFISILITQQLNHISIKEDLRVSMGTEVRNKLAQDMHDGVAQQLFLLSAQIFKLKQSVISSENNELVQLTELMEKQVKESHLEVREYIKHLKGEVYHIHLFEALKSALNRITSNMNIIVDFNTKGTFIDERIDILETIYRLIEESAYNVVKHAQASNLKVEVEVDSIQWRITIIDNGIGLPEHIVKNLISSKGMGIKGMEERLKGIGGSIDIYSERGEGTRISALIPRWGGELVG